MPRQCPRPPAIIALRLEEPGRSPNGARPGPQATGNLKFVALSPLGIQLELEVGESWLGLGYNNSDWGSEPVPQCAWQAGTRTRPQAAAAAAARFPSPSRVTQVARFKFVPIAVFVFATLITGGARYRDLEVQSAAAAIAAERPRNLIELS